MMGQHLPIIRSPGLQVDDEQLLCPVCKLRQHIPFRKPLDLSVRPIGP